MYAVTTFTGLPVNVVDIPTVTEAQYFRNEAVPETPSKPDRCIVCALPVKVDSLWVNMSVNAYLLPVGCGEPEEYDGGESQGWFRIGPDCAKRVPSEYVTDVPLPPAPARD